MTDLNVLQTLLVGHLWQSVTLAALLAAVLIFGKRMQGTMRYSLAGAAFIAAIALPLAAFIPGESLIKAVLDQMQAPKAATLQPSELPPSTTPEVVPTEASWAANLVTGVVSAATDNGKVKLSETEFGKSIVAEGAPAWAIDLGAKAIQSAANAAPTPPSVAVPPVPAETHPLFTFPEITVPSFNLPDLTLPIALVWLAGALFLMVRIGRDLIAVERLVARARPAELPEALKRRMGDVRVAISPEAPGPMAAGLLNPAIVLPENLALNSPGMAALLEHERAHIQRSDMAVALLQRIALALLWWSPALHWISRRIDEEREVACDEAAVKATGDAKAFARSLTKQAENQLWARAPRLAVGAIGPRSQVGRRIKRLIEIAKGAAPAKYAGRLAFAGLALAVAVAAMITPRFTADAQRLRDLGVPFDSSLGEDRNGGPRDLADLNLSDEQRQDVLDRLDRLDQLAGGPKGDYPAFTGDLKDLMKDFDGELQLALAGLSPELEGELAGLSAEMAALGAEISMLVNQEMAQEMPKIMEEVRQQLAEEGINVDDWDDIQELTGFDHEALQEALQEARDEIRERMGPELREEIRAAMEEARQELAEHRDEIRAAVEQSRGEMESARAQMARVRAEMDAARARGDFDALKNMDFDIDQDVLDKIRTLKDEPKFKGIKIKGDGARSSSERLMRAAMRGDEDLARQLIAEDKANVNAVFRGDGTPLIVAARHGNIEVVRVLLNAGADPNLASPGDGNPLIAAVAHGEADIARLLLERGANVNAPAPGDGNALIAAAQQGEEDMVRMLLSRGADVNAYVPGDETPLMNAAEQGELSIVKMLVDKGAKVNLAYSVNSWWGGSNRTELRSPLNMALKHGRDDVADYLRSKGAIENPKPAN